MAETVWDTAERRDGAILEWLTDTARNLKAVVGIGFAEAAPPHFYNSYALAGPSGELLGVVRKRRTEFNIFRTGDGSRVLDTPLGRIGIGICADNHYADMPVLFRRECVDLVLMPHAWPVPIRTAKLVSDEEIRTTDELVRGYAQFYSRTLGVPTVFANQTGPISRGWPGILGRLMNPDIFGYAGRSAISDSDASLVAQGGMEEDVVVGTVVLDPSRKKWAAPKTYGGWLHPGSFIFRRLILPIGIASSKIKYATSRERKRKAAQTARSGSTGRK